MSKTICQSCESFKQAITSRSGLGVPNIVDFNRSVTTIHDVWLKLKIKNMKKEGREGGREEEKEERKKKNRKRTVS